jgi:hypothetical protein
MAKQAVFKGLVFDEQDRPVEVVYIGDEPCYMVDDDGFRRHISSEDIDRQVFQAMADMIAGHEDILSKQTARMIGTEDPFSLAMIESQLKNIDQQLDNLMQTGIPEDARLYLGMAGFKIIIDIHGNVIEVTQPGLTEGEGDE